MYLAGEGISLHFSTYNWLTVCKRGYRYGGLCVFDILCIFAHCMREDSLTRFFFDYLNFDYKIKQDCYSFQDSMSCVKMATDPSFY